MENRQKEKCKIEVFCQIFLNECKKKGFLTKKGIKCFQSKINEFGETNLNKIQQKGREMK